MCLRVLNQKRKEEENEQHRKKIRIGLLGLILFLKPDNIVGEDLGTQKQKQACPLPRLKILHRCTTTTDILSHQGSRNQLPKMSPKSKGPAETCIILPWPRNWKGDVHAIFHKEPCRKDSQLIERIMVRGKKITSRTCGQRESSIRTVMIFTLTLCRHATYQQKREKF